MKTRRVLFTIFVLSLLAAIAVTLVGGSTPAVAASAPTTVVVPISGTVHGSPESVYLAGQAVITSTTATDSTSGLPLGVTLSIDLTNVSGQGLSTGTTYVSEAQSVTVRQLVASDLVEIAFPFFPSGPGGFLSARSALATFTLTYNVTTGQLTGGTAAAVTTPNF